MKTVPMLEFIPPQPVNLREVLEMQARCLIDVDLPQQIGIDRVKFLDDAMVKAKEFIFSVGLAILGFDRVCMVHYGVSNRYLAEVAGVSLWADPDQFTLYKGVALPEGIHIIQGQFGLKYKNKTPSIVRLSHDPVERLGVPNEGLLAYIYWGDALLNESFHYYPGAVVDPELVPCLHVSDKGAVMRIVTCDHADPRYGSVSISCIY